MTNTTKIVNTVDTAEELINLKELRDKNIERVEVLDRVKKLFLVPDIECMTTKMVADYYEVDLQVIQRCYLRNKNEIQGDGVVKYKKDDLAYMYKTYMFKNINDNQRCMSIELPNYGTVKFTNGGALCFSKRAVLRIGMLLRDSKIAQEVRSQLLNVFEHSNSLQRTAEIDDELELQQNIGKAFMTNDIMELMKACGEAMQYKNRYIEQIENQNTKLVDENALITKKNEELEVENQALTEGNLAWSDRNKLNFAVRKLSLYSRHNFGAVWNELYRELKYRHGIDLKLRKEKVCSKKPMIDFVKEKEWDKVIKSFSAMCNRYGTNCHYIFSEDKDKKAIAFEK